MLVLIYPAFVLISVPSVVMLSELFPRAIRATGMSLVYCLGVSVFGGFAQFFATGLLMVKETAGRPLDYP